MKTFLISILSVICGLAYGAQTNTFNSDKPSRLYVASDTQELNTTTNQGWDGVPSYDQHGDFNFHWNVSNHYDHTWQDGVGGQGFKKYVDIGWHVNSHPYTNTTTATLIWTNNGDGVEIDVGYDGTISTNWIGQPMIANEHCAVHDPMSAAPYTIYPWVEPNGAVFTNTFTYSETYDRTAQTKWRLETGGKALSGRVKLWNLSGSAAELLNKRATPFYVGVPTRPITANTLTINGHVLSDAGDYWTVLPDGTNIDVTPYAAGKDFYTFTVQALPVDITVKKQGDAVPPTNGVVVKNGDTLTIGLIGSSQTPITSASGQPVWKYRQLKFDGTYTDWQPFGTSGTGAQFDYTTTTSGIFQAEAVFYGDDANAAKYVRKQDDLKTSNGFMGPGRKGDPDSFGVCDTQKQIDIRNEASSYLGSTAYDSHVVLPAQYGFSQFGTNGNEVMRCSIFVAHRCCAVGATVPAINGWFHSYPPLANQWAGVMSTSHLYFTTAISGWTLLSNTAFPQPGFIIAHPDASDAGHCAIIDYDGGGIGAGMSGTVNKNYEEFYDGTSRYRSYNP